MNRENLLKMARHVASLPQDKLNMAIYYIRHLDCGCVIGNCVELDTQENINKYKGYRDYLEMEESRHTSNFDYCKWSMEFTGLERNGIAWSWCFSGRWSQTDNTPAGAAKRILYLLEYGVPESFKKGYTQNPITSDAYDPSIYKDIELCFEPILELESLK